MYRNLDFAFARHCCLYLSSVEVSECSGRTISERLVLQNLLEPASMNNQSLNGLEDAVSSGSNPDILLGRRCIKLEVGSSRIERRAPHKIRFYTMHLQFGRAKVYRGRGASTFVCPHMVDHRKYVYR